jgi:hypothetical protein
VKRAHNDDGVLTDEEIRLRHARDVEAQTRAREALEKVKQGHPPGPVIETEELADLLRQRG